MLKPTVTVLVPCYNYTHYLRQCVRSVLDQADVEVDVLVIDDASTDNSADVASAMARQDSRVRLVSLPTNIGMVPAVNFGLDQVIGDYFVKLDADDMLTPGSLQRSLSLFERHPNLGFVYGRPRHFTGDVPPVARVGKPRWTVWSGARWLELRYRRAVNCISQPEAVIRTSALRQVGPYNESLPHTSDLEMWLRLAAIAPVGRINRVDQGYYRVHCGSMQRTVNAGLLKDFIGRRDAFLSALSAVGNQTHFALALEKTVRKEVARQALDCCCRAFDRERVDTVPVLELAEFAFATFPASATLPEWKGLERRRRQGTRSRWSPDSLIFSVMRRTREEIAHFRWVRTGV
jgi:hypothetical protein